MMTVKHTLKTENAARGLIKDRLSVYPISRY